MIELQLVLTFLKIGLFSIGGGLATLPLIQAYVVETGWITPGEFVDMIAIAESTPGPIGVNIATFAGYRIAGLTGAIMATAGLITPSLLIMMLIAHFMRAHKHHPIVQRIMGTLRPTAIGMIAAAIWFVTRNAIIHPTLYPATDPPNYGPPLILIVLVALHARYPRMHPLLFIATGALLAFLPHLIP